MVYKLKLVSDEKANFCREIEIDGDSNFLQLRNVILDSVGYTKDQLDSFFICDDDWVPQQEITLEDMGSSSDEDIYLMADTTIYDLVEDEGQKISFMFDYLTERCFFMDVQEIVPGRRLAEPICTMKMGKAPEQELQVEEEVVDPKKVKPITDLDDDLFGDEGYNEDEISDGYDLGD